MTTKRRVLLVLVAVVALCTPSHAQFRTLFGGVVPQYTISGCTSTSGSIVPGTPINLTATGTCTITVNRSTPFTLTGCAAGGGGGDSFGGGSQDGGGGGKGAGCTTGTSVFLEAGKTYQAVIPAATTGNGSGLTFTNTTDSITLLSCSGGNKGGEPAGSTTGGSCSTGSNTFTGGNGGNGGTEASPGTSTAGQAQASGAGGGGGGQPADGSSSPQAGGAGKSASGHSPSGGNGGQGGGTIINSVECGGGGGGAIDNNSNPITGQTGQQGCAALTP